MTHPQDSTSRSSSLRRARATGMIAGAVGVAALGAAGIVGINVATAADSPTPSATSTAAPNSGPAPVATKKRDRAGHARGGFSAFPGSPADLAEKLGVSKDALKDAMATVRDDRRDARAERGGAADKRVPGEQRERTAQQEKAQQQKLAAALAKALDLETADVTTALKDLRTEAKADRTAAFQDRLDQAVEDGTLTRAEADAVLKAGKAGVIGLGGRGAGAHRPR